MKQRMQQLGQDSRRHATEELRQRLDAEMAKPAEQRDYALIEDLSAACCEMMGIREAAEASVPQGIQAVLDRVNGRGPEAQSETFIVETVKPSFWRCIPALAACLMLMAGALGGVMLLRMDPGEKLPAPQPDASENYTLETQAPTEGFTVPVAVPVETDPATEAMTMETAPPETVLVTDATAPTESHAAPEPEPQHTQAAVTPVQQTTTAPLPPDPTEPMTETTTETIPAPTEPQPEEHPTEPATDHKPTTRLIKLNYELGWIPEGYALTSEELEQADDYEIRILTYTSDAGTIMFRQRTRNAPPLAPYETDELPEDCTMQNIRIGPYTGYLAQDSSGCTLTWDVGEYLFTLTGDNADDLQKASLMLRIGRSSKTENEQEESL
ncbi:MAG: DUF4367 domain-containing protein [Oscillospiraceae bacterium]|nr:DUF4367 domain-containing protein [Oscillospiraceae bacterium]